MMDVEKLIKQLRSAAKLEAYYNSEYNGLYNQTADALEKLQTELQKSEHDNVNLTGELEKVAAELEQVKAERDAAVKDIIGLLYHADDSELVDIHQLELHIRERKEHNEL